MVGICCLSYQNAFTYHCMSSCEQYKTLEAMFDKVKTDEANVSAGTTSERADKIPARTRGSGSPFRCISTLVQQMNQEKDQELSSARLRIEELEALAACRYKEVNKLSQLSKEFFGTRWLSNTCTFLLTKIN